MAFVLKNTFVAVEEVRHPLRRTRTSAAETSFSVETKPLRVASQDSITSDASTAASSDQDKPVLLIRNVPNHLKERRLVEKWNDAGFKGCYDMFFMPTTKAGNNLGYAFIRFHSRAEAEEFAEEFQGLVLRKKALEITFARQQREWNAKPAKGSTARPCFFDADGEVIAQ